MGLPSIIGSPKEWAAAFAPVIADAIAQAIIAVKQDEQTALNFLDGLSFTITINKPKPKETPTT